MQKHFTANGAYLSPTLPAPCAPSFYSPALRDRAALAYLASRASKRARARAYTLPRAILYCGAFTCTITGGLLLTTGANAAGLRFGLAIAILGLAALAGLIATSPTR